MDGFELVMRHRHADQRVDVALLVDEALPVGQLLAQQRLARGRRVDHVSGLLVGKRGAGHLAHLHLHALDQGLHQLLAAIIQ